MVVQLLLQGVKPARFRDAVKQQLALEDGDLEPLKYHCRAQLVARGGKTMEPLGLQAVLDSASGVTGISEHLLERLRKYFGGKDVSPLKSRPCQVSVADGRALKA